MVRRDRGIFFALWAAASGVQAAADALEAEAVASGTLVRLEHHIGADAT
jgi:hypothetical protein